MLLTFDNQLRMNILNLRGLFEETPLLKNYGIPWKEGIVRLEVDKIINETEMYHRMN